MFVWDESQGVRTDVNRAGEFLWGKGLYSGSRPGDGSGLRVIRAQGMFEAIERLIISGSASEYLYSVQAVGSG